MLHERGVELVQGESISVGIHELALRRPRSPHNTTLRRSERDGGCQETGTHLIPLPHDLEHGIARADF